MLNQVFTLFTIWTGSYLCWSIRQEFAIYNQRAFRYDSTIRTFDFVNSPSSLANHLISSGQIECFRSSGNKNILWFLWTLNGQYNLSVPFFDDLLSLQNLFYLLFSDKSLLHLYSVLQIDFIFVICHFSVRCHHSYLIYYLDDSYT